MSKEELLNQIKKDVSGNDVVLYMKGTAAQPRCGFSAVAAQMLGQLGISFKDVDALSDPEFRETLREYSNWPTLPQLFVKGELVGGCDIMKEMYQSGELQELLKEKGVKAG